MTCGLLNSARMASAAARGDGDFQIGRPTTT